MGSRGQAALVASYAYDAWGKCTILSGNDSVDSIANINPFRYRSYYYDTETGLYYLETRYYDPEIGRFISADSIEYLDPETIGGLNLFSYCNNNPVTYADPKGNAPWLIIGLIVVFAVIGGILGGLSKERLIFPKPDGEKLTGWDRTFNVFVGALGGCLILGLGLIVVAAGLEFAGIATLAGYSILQLTAFGILIYNSAAIILSIFGVEIELLEYESKDPVSYPRRDQ